MQEVDIGIVGSGFSGLAMAVRLKQAGRHDFAIFEREQEVGGTWAVNTYPGCACDVPSHLYSFSFAPNPGWTQTYSKQAEIRDYLQSVAEDFGVLPHVRFGHAVTEAEWDAERGRWILGTSQGTYAARVAIGGFGPLTEPSIPDLPGLEDFEGTVFHSARWNHGHDLTGERVASIGTGASAIQYVPKIQPKVSKLHVFQRTPPWIMPHTNRRTTRLERRAYARFPALQKLVRAGVYAGRETFVVGFTKRPQAMKLAERIARRHMATQIDDPDLREKVTPEYTIGCKRILPTNRWYPALGRPNVELVTDAIERVTRTGVVTADGTEREVDTIVFGTGFQVADIPAGHVVRGREGRTLHDVWEGSPRAYLGTAVAGFPNMFILLGPNTGLGHSSMVYMIESQVAHVMRALEHADRAGAHSLEVRPDAQAAYNRDLDARMEGTVWNTGCASWYFDATGRNATLWPDWTFRFRRRAAAFDPAAYETAPRPTAFREAVPA